MKFLTTGRTTTGDDYAVKYWIGIANPLLFDNMQRIDQIAHELQAFGGVSKEEIDSLFKQIGYTEQLPEYWTLDSYRAEREIMEQVRCDVMAGKDIEAIIPTLSAPKKKLVWRDGRPFWDTE